MGQADNTSFKHLQPHAFSLDDKYALDSGTVLLTGIQALVRAIETRARLDRQQGLETGGFVSGYRGSPLGGLDQSLWQEQARLQDLGVTFQPAINEDLAATAVWGSQQVGLHAGNTVEGVFGFWYGKAPGLDRSCDAIRHANMWGTSPQGGVLLVVGDDPAAKSSSLASQSEFTFQDLMIPMLAPANLQEVVDFSVLGWEMSRASGLWVGLKAIADQMDSSAIVDVGLERYAGLQAARADSDVYIRREDTPAAQEQRVLAEKLPLALEYAQRAGLNRWITRAHDGDAAQLGIVCAGKAYADVREALSLLGLVHDADIAAAGIRLLKLGMSWPLDDALVREFAAGTDALLVVEEKRAFVEPGVREALYGSPMQLPVYGKRGPDGSPLVPATGILDACALAFDLARLAGVDIPAALEASRQQIAHLRYDAPARQERTPLFCAGCPHNTSTRVPEGSRATAGIGCHYMAQWMDRETDSCTQMGGEGVTWMGEAPFTRERHIFANLGDGTYFHSGLLAVRQAVAAGLNITYKVLFNDAVAMTGGQAPDGELTVAGLVQQVQAEGVERVVVVSDDADLHRADPRITRVAKVHDRSELDMVQQQLRTSEGVSVLIYQQTCATALRKQRKRGEVADTRPRLLINEAVCEGCGDCSVQSSCVAVEPVETADGTKRRINQTVCNKDLSCATGYCPAFVEVQGAVKAPTQALQSLQAPPAPVLRAGGANLLVTGIGGTGIVTLSALLGVAARLENKFVTTLDMTGLAQKGGAVFAHVRIDDAPVRVARIPRGAVDLLVGCDLVSSASSEALGIITHRTAAVVNTHITPTSEFALGQGYDAQRSARLQRLCNVIGKPAHEFAVEDYLESVMGSTLQANVFLLGYAYQLGYIPLQASSIAEAMRLNGTQVERNQHAFMLGRIAAHAPAQLPGKLAAAVEPEATVEAQSAAQIAADRAAHLVAYQGQALAERYLVFVERVRECETAIAPGSDTLTATVAVSYARLLAVKDEYEVARLMVAPEFSAALGAQFESGAKLRYLMAPPLLGTRKRRLPGITRSVFMLLARLRRIRNTWLDPFAWTSTRREELAMIAHFEERIGTILSKLNRQNLPLAVAIAKLPQQVRGFGHVKAAAWARACTEEERLWLEFVARPETVRVFDPHMDRAA